MRRTPVIVLALVLASVTAPAAADDFPAWGRHDPKPSATPEQEPRAIDPALLPRGPDAAVDHLQDGVIHTAGGRRIAVDVASTEGQLALLGRQEKSWLIAWGRGARFGVSRVRPGRAPVGLPRQRSTPHLGGASHWLLSDDGRMLLGSSCSRSGTWLAASDAVGRRLGHLEHFGCSTPLDADAGRVVTYGEHPEKYAKQRIYVWAPGGLAYAKVARSAVAADIAEDRLFVWTSGRNFGPTSLSAPGTPAWARPFRPLDISPDGSLAVGLRISEDMLDDPAILEVRDVSDGRLVDAIDLGHRITEDNWTSTRAHDETLRWESDRAFVFQLTTSRGEVLVRCRASGPVDRRCELASEPGGDISTAHEYFEWPRSP